MNKLIILLAVVGCAGLVSAGSGWGWMDIDSQKKVTSTQSPAEVQDEASEFALFESDEKETAGLGESKAVFADFCKDARDHVKAHLKNSVNSGAARVFNLIAETLSHITAQVGQANSKAVEEGSKMVSEDAKSMKSAVLGVASAFTGATKEQLMDTIGKLKEQLNQENLKEAADEACLEIVSKVKPQVEKRFNAYKKEIQQAPGAEKLDLSDVRLNNVGCLTTGRLNKVANGCNLVRTLGPSMMEFIG